MELQDAYFKTWLSLESRTNLFAVTAIIYIVKLVKTITVFIRMAIVHCIFYYATGIK